MCRLLCVHSRRPFAIEPHLDVFAAIARDSREYQGHGWGCAWLVDGRWRLYRDIRPVWEDRRDRFGETTLLLAHARSAFRDEGICVENNMPFDDGRHVFIFNGELRGVRIREQGRIGAEKIFNYVKRFDRGDMHAALERGLAVIEKRTRYVRALNMILASPSRVHVSCRFAEDPDYFQMWERDTGGVHIVCSDPYPETTGPETTGPDTTGPDTAGPDTAGPDTTGPDTTGPETTEPGTTGWTRIDNGAVLTHELPAFRRN